MDFGKPKQRSARSSHQIQKRTPGAVVIYDKASIPHNHNEAFELGAGPVPALPLGEMMSAEVRAGSGEGGGRGQVATRRGARCVCHTGI